MGKNNALKYLLPIRCAAFFLIFLIGAAISGRSIGEISNWWTIIAVIVNILLLTVLILITKKNKNSFAELINYKKGATKPKQIVLISLLILSIGMGGMFLAGFICYGVFPYAAPMMIAPVSAWWAIADVLLLPITTALAEDGLYLGCGVNQINGKIPAILIPAFFFALQHSFIPTIFDIRYILYRFLSFLPLTVILCVYYYKDRNPLPIIIGHTIIDFATAGQILATSVIPGFYDMMIHI